MSRGAVTETQSPLAGLAGLLAVCVVAVLTLEGLEAPAALPETAPSTQFSAARAARHVELLAAEPRPVGSAHHDRVRDYLVAELQELGLEVHLQETSVVRRLRSGRVAAGRVANVVGRLRGSEESEAILLVAHYDSVPSGPGAGDDASGVAVILEALRALAAGPELRNQVMVLFSDAEELGLLGAQAFLDEDPWAQEVALVLNLEARGNRGPSVLFETSRGNGRLIRAAGAAAPFLYTSSSAADIYRRMPNDTDLTVFLKAGIPGLNFAFFEGYAAYHTQLDTPARLDRGSLQHHGANTLALVRHFGDESLDALEDHDAVFFTPLAGGLVVYPVSWAPWLAAAAVLLVAALLGGGVARGVTTVRGVVRGSALFVVSVALGPALAALVWSQIRSRGPQALAAPHGTPYGAGWALLGSIALVLAIAAAIWAAGAGKSRAAELFAAALVAWAILGLAAAWLLPGASYLFLWPTAGGLVGLALVVAVPKVRASPGLLLGVLTAAVLPAVVVLAPTIHLAFVALGLDGVVIPMLLAALMAGLLAPHLVAVSRRPPGWFPGALALVAVAAPAWVLLGRGFDAEHPRVDSLLYLLDADTGEAAWLSFDHEPDGWTATFLGAEPDRRQAPAYLVPAAGAEVLTSPAPVAGLSPARVDLISDEPGEEARLLTLELRWAHQVPLLRVRAESLASIRAVHVGDRRIEVLGPGPLRLLFFAIPEGACRIALEMSDRQPVEMALVEHAYGLPDLAGMERPRRPPELIPRPGWQGEATLVHVSAWH